MSTDIYPLTERDVPQELNLELPHSCVCVRMRVCACVRAETRTYDLLAYAFATSGKIN